MKKFLKVSLEIDLFIVIKLFNFVPARYCTCIGLKLQLSHRCVTVYFHPASKIFAVDFCHKLFRFNMLKVIEVHVVHLCLKFYR